MMISVWHLLWIIPAAASLGMLIMALVRVGSAE